MLQLLGITFVLFDMDGTLTDTQRLQPWAVRRYALGSKVPFREVQRRMASVYYHNHFTWVNPKTPVLLSKALDISVLRLLVAGPLMAFQVLRGMRKERLFADAVATLTTLKDNGFMVGLATNGTKFEVKHKISSVIDLFDVLVTSSDVSRKKPDPEMIAVGMRKAGRKPEETLYVGDTLVDMLAAANAQTHFALVGTGTFGPEVVRVGQDRPEHVFPSLTALRDFLLPP